MVFLEPPAHLATAIDNGGFSCLLYLAHASETTRDPAQWCVGVVCWFRRVRLALRFRMDIRTPILVSFLASYVHFGSLIRIWVVHVLIRGSSKEESGPAVSGVCVFGIPIWNPPAPLYICILV